MTISENSKVDFCRGPGGVAGGDGGGDIGLRQVDIGVDWLWRLIASSIGVLGVGGGFAGSGRDEFLSLDAFLRPKSLVRDCSECEFSKGRSSDGL